MKIKNKLLNYITRFLVDTKILFYMGFRGYMLIDEGDYEYPYFNTDFMRSILSRSLYCLLKGYKPVICLKNRQQGWTNWDTFFIQPYGGSVEQCSAVCKHSGYYSYGNHTPYLKSHQRRWNKIYKYLVKFNAVTLQRMNDEYIHLIPEHVKTLGVKLRGTDYVNNTTDLPRQPQVKDVIGDVRQFVEKWHYSKIFLATEEKQIADMFIGEFKDMLIISESMYYDDLMKEKGVTTTADLHFERDNDNYCRGMEYLSQLYILSRCNALIAGNHGGSQMALSLNDARYEYVKIYNLGIKRAEVK